MEIQYSYFDPLLTIIRSYMDQEDVDRVRQAYAIAYEGHDGQTRSSGEPYITHPVAVACILAEMGLDVETVQAAVLHDVIEDTKYTRQDLIELFGEQVTHIVDGVSKLDKLKFRTRQEAEVANFRKMILAMTKDVRVVMIKLADRTHNMLTIGALRPDKQRRIARETLDIYSALASRLGITNIKNTLDNNAFKALYPMRYAVLKNGMENALYNYSNKIENTITHIKERLEEWKIPTCDVSSQPMPILKIYQKLRDKQIKFRSIYDVCQVVIIANSIDDCYRVIGCLHSLYKPVPQSFKDFIALPKLNGFQSLVTSLINNEGEILEVLVRTPEMEDVAKRGIATTLFYNKGENPRERQDRIQQWLDSLAELQHASVNSMEFNNSVKSEIFPEDIYVFTPRGKIIALPPRSTALDFAYHIHTGVGQTAVSATVDGEQVGLDFTLKNGQTVDIQTSSEITANENQLGYLISSRARARLRQILKDLKLEAYIQRGRSYMESLYGHPVEELDAQAVEKALEFFNLKSLNDLFAEICFGNIISPVVKAVLDSYMSGNNSSDNILADLQKGTLVSDLTYADYKRIGYNIDISTNSYIAPHDPITLVGNLGKGLIVYHSESSELAALRLTPYQKIRINWGIEELPGALLLSRLSFNINQAREDLVNRVSSACNVYRSNTFRSMVNAYERDKQYHLVIELKLHSVADYNNLMTFLSVVPELNLENHQRLLLGYHNA